MIFARCVDMFWLIEPNFAMRPGTCISPETFGILAYITVPLAVMALWAAFYLTELTSAAAGQRERSSPRRDAGA